MQQLDISIKRQLDVYAVKEFWREIEEVYDVINKNPLDFQKGFISETIIKNFW